MTVYIFIFEINLFNFEEGHDGQKAVAACSMVASDPGYTQGLSKFRQASFEVELRHHVFRVVHVRKVQPEQLEKFFFI